MHIEPLTPSRHHRPKKHPKQNPLPGVCRHGRAATVRTAPLCRFLCYATAGGELPAHVDLTRTWGRQGLRSTHSFLLYLSDCRRGGETLLLETLPGDNAIGVVPGARATLERIVPRVGRLLLMPHACPHAAAPVVDAPKLLLRGELRLEAPRVVVD